MISSMAIYQWDGLNEIVLTPREMVDGVLHHGDEQWVLDVSIRFEFCGFYGRDEEISVFMGGHGYFT